MDLLSFLEKDMVVFLKSDELKSLSTAGVGTQKAPTQNMALETHQPNNQSQNLQGKKEITPQQKQAEKVIDQQIAYLKAFIARNDYNDALKVYTYLRPLSANVSLGMTLRSKVYAALKEAAAYLSKNRPNPNQLAHA